MVFLVGAQTPWLNSGVMDAIKKMRGWYEACLIGAKGMGVLALITIMSSSLAVIAPWFFNGAMGGEVIS